MTIVISGSVVEEDGISLGQIKIEETRIESFVRGGRQNESPYQLLSFAEYKGNRGLPEFLIFPGFIDLYARTPERLPALSGGITSVLKYGTYVEPSPKLPDLSDCKNVTFNWHGDKDHTTLAEIEGVRKAVTMTKLHNLRSRIVISTVESLRIVQEAKQDGWEVYSEVHPVNLYFDSTMVTPENKNSLRCSPPIRSPEHREQLFEAYAGGYIDIISSGHTPHDLNDGIVGVPELDTFGPMMAWLISQDVSPEVIFKTACLNPSQWVPGSTFMVGRIKQGYEANITVLAFNKPAIDSRQIYAKCGWSPYDLRHFNGSVEAVILKGEKVVSGQWVKD